MLVKFKNSLGIYIHVEITRHSLQLHIFAKTVEVFEELVIRRDRTSLITLLPHFVFVDTVLNLKWIFQSLGIRTLLITKLLSILRNPLFATRRNTAPGSTRTKKRWVSPRKQDKQATLYLSNWRNLDFGSHGPRAACDSLQKCSNSPNLLSIWPKFRVFANQQQNYANARKGSPFNIECSRIHGKVC